MYVRRQVSVVRAIWAPSVARRVLRHRGVWVLAAVLGGVGALLTLSARAEAIDQRRDSWGNTQSVVVVTDEIAVGEPIAGAVEFQIVPRAVVPTTAVLGVAESWTAEDRHAKVALYPGEILLADRISRTGARALPIGTSALTLSVVTQLPLVRDGDLVDLWMIDSANLSSRRIARQVVVLASSASDITVAIPDEQIAEATVASLRAVTVVLVG